MHPHKIFAVVLLSLLSVSFILENAILFEGEITELVDRSEKDKDTKEKKLLFASELCIASILDQASKTELNLVNLDILNGIFLDVVTPPPEWV